MAVNEQTPENMKFIPRNASDDEVLDIVRYWEDTLSREEYDVVFDTLGLQMGWKEPNADSIRSDVKDYRSREDYPGVEDFVVTDWRTAEGGKSSPDAYVQWYKPNDLNMGGAIAYDLPLNGRWSDLTADFVFWDTDDPRGFELVLEEINSLEQFNREAELQEAVESDEEMTVP